jgi:hypothetical protein
MSYEVDRPPDARFGRPRPARGDVIRGDVDEPFRQSMADLSRQLAARMAQGTPPIDPQTDVEPAPEPVEPERHEAERYVPERHVPERHQPERHEPERQVGRPRFLLPVMAFALGVAIAAGLHAFLAKAPESPQRSSVAAAAMPPLAEPSVTTVATPPTPVIVDPPPVTAPVVVLAPEPVMPQGKLEIYEVMEIQTRLKAIGLYPGPLDGVAGALTKAAIKRYEASRDQPQSGKLDRELLKQLRQEQNRSASSR